MPTTAERLRKAEDKVARAQAALERTRSGLHAAEEVVAATEKATRHPVLLALGFLVIVGVIWMFVQSRSAS